MTKLNDAIGKVLQDGADTPKELKQAFDALGISMADVQKHGDDLDWMLATMAEGFADVKTQAERTTIAKALFGREGAKLLPLLEQGAEKLREYEQAARDAGAVLSGDLDKAYADLGDRLDAAAKKLEVQKGRILPALPAPATPGSPRSADRCVAARSASPAPPTAAPPASAAHGDDIADPVAASFGRANLNLS